MLSSIFIEKTEAGNVYAWATDTVPVGHPGVESWD